MSEALPGVALARKGIEQADPSEVFEGPAPTAPPASAVPASPVPLQPSAPAAPIAQDPGLIPDDPAALFTPDIGDYIDADLLETLHKQAKGGTSLAEVFSMAGLAMTDPDSARQKIALKEGGVQAARQLLAQLQSQISSQRKAMIAASAQQKTADDKLALQELKGLQAQALELEKSSKGKVALKARPSDIKNPEALRQWYEESSLAIAEHDASEKKRERQGKAWQAALDWSLKLGKTGTEADFKETLSQVLLGSGVPAEDVAALNFDAIAKALSGTADQTRALNEAKIQDLQAQAARSASLANSTAERLQLGWASLGRLDFASSVKLAESAGMLSNKLEQDAVIAKSNAVSLKDGDPRKKEWLARADQAAANAIEMTNQALMLQERAFQLQQAGDPAIAVSQVFNKRMMSSPFGGPDLTSKMIWLKQNRMTNEARAMIDGMVSDLAAGKSEHERLAMRSWLDNFLFQKMRADVVAPFNDAERPGLAPSHSPSGGANVGARPTGNEKP
jgi:hypothetical protein